MAQPHSSNLALNNINLAADRLCRRVADDPAGKAVVLAMPYGTRGKGSVQGEPELLPLTEAMWIGIRPAVSTCRAYP